MVSAVGRVGKIRHKALRDNRIRKLSRASKVRHKAVRDNRIRKVRRASSLNNKVKAANNRPPGWAMPMSLRKPALKISRNPARGRTGKTVSKLNRTAWP